MRKIVKTATIPSANITNPVVKTGDEVILKSSVNGHSPYIGRIFTVMGNYGGYFQAKLKDNPSIIINIYSSNPCDTYVYADKQSQIKYYKEAIENKEKDIVAIKKELDFLEKYDSEEDFVAEKLHAIMKSKSKAKTAELLKELKKSNYL